MEKLKAILALAWLASIYGLITLGLGAIADKHWPLYSEIVSIRFHWLWCIGGFFVPALLFGAMDGGLSETVSGDGPADSPADAPAQASGSLLSQRAAKPSLPPVYEVQKMLRNSNSWVYVSTNSVEAFAIQWLENNRNSAMLKNAVAARIIEKRSNAVVFSTSL